MVSKILGKDKTEIKPTEEKWYDGVIPAPIAAQVQACDAFEAAAAASAVKTKPEGKVVRIESKYPEADDYPLFVGS